MKERRYQAFVSSTYTDLIEERKEVTQAILENNCFPAGMELFPAANQSQWEFIKKVIKESDFYIVIIAGRYGSIGKDKEGKKVSYTEREFDYACSLKKPIIVLLRNNIEELPVSKCETTADKNAKLKKFRDKAQNGRLIKYWRTPGELHAAVGLSIRNLVEDSDNKMIGWMRSDIIHAEEETTILLREENKQLKEKISVYERYNKKFVFKQNERIILEIKPRFEKAKDSISIELSREELFSVLGRAILSSGKEGIHPIIGELASQLGVYDSDKMFQLDSNAIINELLLYEQIELTKMFTHMGGYYEEYQEIISLTEKGRDLLARTVDISKEVTKRIRKEIEKLLNEYSI